MNSTQNHPAPDKSRSSAPQQKPATKPAGGHGSASQKADAEAKRGEPLSASKPGERSPKQENL